MPVAYALQVVHGGDNDVLWLQRDFHIYMVNVFDTEKACQVDLYITVLTHPLVWDSVHHSMQL